MRIHELSFGAIGPFAGHEAIDFKNLTQSGLFLLEGPTGAGKSTVIDALVFALFGALADSEADKHRMRSDYAAAADESFVSLTFEVASGIYRIRRTPQYERPKRRGAGATTAQSTARLWRFTSANDRTGELVCGNVAEASQEVARILGLSRAQFTQTVVLPQGQFAQFLRAGNDQRKELLQRIFGTEIYQALVEELRARRLAASRRIDTLAGAVRVAAHDLAVAWPSARSSHPGGDGIGGGAGGRDEAGGADGADGIGGGATSWPGGGGAGGRDEAGGTDEADGADGIGGGGSTEEEIAAAVDALIGGQGAAALEALAGEALAQANRARDQAERSLTEASEAARAARAAAVGASDRAKGAAERARLEARLEALAAAEPERRQTDGRITAARRAREVLPLVAAAEAAEGQQREAADAARALGLLQPDEPLSRLDETRYQTALDSAALAENQAVERLEAAQQLDAARRSEIAAKESLGKTLQAAEAADKAAQEAEAAATRAADEAPRVKAEIARLMGLAGHVAAHRAAVDRSAALAGALDQAKRVFVVAGAEERAAREARLAGIAGEMAEALVTGEPCPVCGSTEHPAPSARAVGAVTLQDVKKAERAREQAETGYEAAAKAVEAAAHEVAELAASAAGAGAEQVAEQLAAARAELRDLGEPAALAKAALRAGAQAEQARRALAAQAEALTAAHDKVMRLVGQSAGPSASGEQAAADGVDGVDGADGVDGVAVAQAALDAASAAKQRARAELTAAREGTAAWQKAAEAAAAAAAALGAAGFASAAAARAAHMPDDQIKRLAEELTRAAAEFLAVRERLADAALVAAVGDPATLEAEARRAEAQADAVELAERRLTSELALAAAAAERTAEAAKAVGTTADAFDQGRRQAAALVRVAELTAAGNGNLRGVDLPTYVLIRRFEEVIAAANDRLAPMSAGRYRLEHSETKEAVRGRRTGLAVRVRDNQTGEPRDPRTLSGGETFYVSLALALGLADVVTAEAGGISLETLFVDEGFGALDNEALDAVLTQLVRLRDGGRVVGIVSHVEALKQEIPERVEVRRLAGGGSTLRLRA